MSVDDYFTTNKYQGTIYKTNNMLGQTLRQYCPTDSAMTAEQKKIEKELKDFEKNIYGDMAKKDSLDSIAAAEKDAKTVKKSRSRRGSSGTSVRRTRRGGSNSAGGNGSARVTVRRERH